MSWCFIAQALLNPSPTAIKFLVLRRYKVVCLFMRGGLTTVFKSHDLHKFTCRITGKPNAILILNRLGIFGDLTF